MQKQELARVFHKASELLALGAYPPAYAADVLDLIRFLSFMSQQIEKDLQNADPTAGSADSSDPQAD